MSGQRNQFLLSNQACSSLRLTQDIGVQAPYKLSDQGGLTGPVLCEKSGIHVAPYAALHCAVPDSGSVVLFTLPSNSPACAPTSSDTQLMHARAHACTCTLTSTHSCTHTNAHTHTHSHPRTHNYSHTQVHIGTNTHTPAYNNLVV